LSSSCASSNNVTESIEELGSICDAIELTGGGEYRPELLDLFIQREYVTKFKILIHSYFPPVKDSFLLNFADESDNTRRYIEKAMHWVRACSCPYYSIHAGFKKNYRIEGQSLTGGEITFSERGILRNIEWFLRSFDQELILENLYPVGNRDVCFFANFRDIVSLLECEPRIGLLLDLGHLKVSSCYFGFDFDWAVEQLFENYASRIKEIHLSENLGFDDEHLLVLEDSEQLSILKRYRKMLKKNNTNLTIEARGYELSDLSNCFYQIKKILEG
jgi:sugar phosphate isomerase/epimerase